ncbi:ABC transporter ATP-binding protein [Clostridium intestinale]|uniref:ABC-2 type transport system ATP-binding protein n=1 Tax=Clostridium intestinale DSM 6191 TaxID=1121320 RepID=A0A1M5UXC9_9CLOT|nr:ABC transporter ATP-binding protein [Clostridium intestinale]SHH67590.1 ABC-2 type transport system ATP-binding protein [Clostridium intestinale DSM 6191]
MSRYIVETKNLVKVFNKVKSVDSVNLKIKEGEIYGFLGPNGAGKSTTIKMLLGLIRANSGEVYIFGKSIKENREEILKNIGALVESPSYYGHLTAYENLDILKRMLKLNKEEIEEKLKLVNLWEERNKKVNEFSLGMKQRLGIAQALMGNPKLLILDEPTNGLDPAGIIEIRNLIRYLAKEKKITIIISSHILNEIELVATEVGVINKGKLLYQGSLEDLKKNATNEVIIGLEKKEDKALTMKLLLARGYRVEEENLKLKVKGNNLSPSKICREIVMGGYSLNYLAEEKTSLEEIFLGLTKEEKVC